jgi:hypothetical protein
MANLQQEVGQTTKAYVLEVRLDDGETLHADMGDDLDSARAQLASIHSRFGSDAFVLLGEDTVVRSGDIRHVQLHEREVSGPGLLETLKARMGGDEMSTYETGQTQTRRGDGRGQQHSGGILDQAFVGYGRRPWAETKPFFLTSEFAAVLLAIVALAITAGASDSIDAWRFWILTTVLVSFYVLSRGIAKSGTKSRSVDPREDLLRGAVSGEGRERE